MHRTEHMYKVKMCDKKKIKNLQWFHLLTISRAKQANTSFVCLQLSTVCLPLNQTSDAEEKEEKVCNFTFWGIFIRIIKSKLISKSHFQSQTHTHTHLFADLEKKPIWLVSLPYHYHYSETSTQAILQRHFWSATCHLPPVWPLAIFN